VDSSITKTSLEN